MAKLWNANNVSTQDLKEVELSTLVLISVDGYKKEFKSKLYQIVENRGGKCFGDYSSNSFFCSGFGDGFMGCKCDGSIIIGKPTLETVKEFETILNQKKSNLEEELRAWTSVDRTTEDLDGRNSIDIDFDIKECDRLLKLVEEFINSENQKPEETTTDDDSKYDYIYSICSKIMENQTVETFYPFTNKKGQFKVKDYARTVVDSINERVLEDCRKVAPNALENKKVNALVCFFKSMNDTNKFVNGYEIGFNRLVNMFISWTDGKYTFNLKDENDTRTIAVAVAVASLKGYVPTNKMLQVIKNRDNSNVVRVVPFVNLFYSWKEEKELTEEEKSEKAKKEIEKALESLVALSGNMTNTEKMDLLKSLEEKLNIKKIGGIFRKAS